MRIKMQEAGEFRAASERVGATTRSLTVAALTGAVFETVARRAGP